MSRPVRWCCFLLLLFTPSAWAIDSIFPNTKNQLTPSTLWLANQKPLPTNAWFTNFIISNKDKKWSDAVPIFPYLIRVGLQGVGFSYTGPTYYKNTLYPKIDSALYYQFSEQLTLGSKEVMSQYGVERYHGLQVTLNWTNAQQQKMQSPIVQGSPYFTMYFTKATPQLISRFKWLSLNQKAQNASHELNSRYEIRLALDNKKSQTWILYSEKPLQMLWTTSTQGEKLTAAAPYSGWIRLVLQSDSAQGIDNNPALLDQYVETIPVDYTQTYEINDKQANYSIEWQTQNNKAPLMLTLPHQREGTNPLNSSINYWGIKGLMQGTSTKKWIIKLPSYPIQFLKPKAISKVQKNSIHAALTEEADQFLKDTVPEEGPYLTGKRYARVARLILIAHYLEDKKLTTKLIQQLEQLLTARMLTKTKWYFEYDKTWGGIIPSIDDYGARHYNDHHFHYGYWVYTFAVLAHLDIHWLTTPLKKKLFTPKQWIEQLIQDYASEKTNARFPIQRYQDDYSGHSWASGLTSSEDGQNEQSSSEAVNAYYALSLYAKAIDDAQLLAWGRFLMSREIVAAQTYWQIGKENQVYSAQYKKYNQVIGNLWASKIDSDAFFIKCTVEYRCGLQYSFGIQMLPFTDISPYLFTKDWLITAYPTVKKLIAEQYGKITNPWKWILIKGIYLVMDQNEQRYFFQQALESKWDDYDNGDSKTNTLYYLAHG